MKVFASLEDSRGFYLAGGSALAAVYLQHRLSHDVDLFCSDEPLIRLVGAKYEAALAAAGITVTVRRRYASFWDLVLQYGGEETHVQLALDSPYHLSPQQEYSGLRVQGLLDLAVGKLLALFGRAAARDFIDIYLLVTEGHFTMEELIAAARRKDPGLEEYFLAVSFTLVSRLPDRIEDTGLTLFRPVSMPAVKRLFEDAAVSLNTKHAPPFPQPRPS